MKLITKEIESKFKKQGYTGDKKPEDIKIICKLFNPVGAGTWYLYEKEDDDICWAFVNLGDSIMAECGTISLNELKSLRLPMGMSIERDRHFGSYSLKAVIDTVKSGGHV